MSESPPEHEHGLPDSLGVLLVNLGTPDAPTPAAVRRYLKEFLWDPRVVELPRIIWWPILNGFILRFRPARSAKAYAKIWTEDGSPLLIHSRAIADAVAQKLNAHLSGNVLVELAMTYGEPSIDAALEKMLAQGARRIVCLPLYPQYSGTTTASVYDAVTSKLGKRRRVPGLNFISHYHDDPGYIEAVAQSIREYRASNGQGDKLLFSFHGLPKANVDKGDPYLDQCGKTANLVAASLGLSDDDWALSFQSRVGRAEWLRPYTDETIAEFGQRGMASLDVACPGFAADCLETLEEVAILYGKLFTRSGGGKLNYIPALNARDDHVSFLARLITGASK